MAEVGITERQQHWLNDIRAPDARVSVTEKIHLLSSESVLQRIPVDDLMKNFKSISKNLEATNAVSCHRTDQKDINAQEHVGTRLIKLDYLRHSDFFYNNVMSCRFNMQSQLRECDFIKILEDLDL